MEDKKFVRMITKMFDKDSQIKDTEEIVSDGYILYKGEFKKDIFYRLRLESNGQMELIPEKISDLFETTKDYVEVDLKLKYTLPFTNIDVFEVGNETTKPYMGFHKRFRSIFELGGATIYKTKYTNVQAIKSSLLIESEFGQILLMPMSLSDEHILR